MKFSSITQNGIPTEIFEINTTIHTNNTFSIPRVSEIIDDTLECELRNITVPLESIQSGNYFEFENGSQFISIKYSLRLNFISHSEIENNEE